MPYDYFRKDRLYCIRNKETGKETCYSSAEKRDEGVRLKHAFADGWVPSHLRHSKKGKLHGVRSYKR